MSAHHPVLNRLQRAVTRLIKAELESAVQATRPYDEHPRIERELALAKRRYNDALAAVQLIIQERT